MGGFANPPDPNPATPNQTSRHLATHPAVLKHGEGMSSQELGMFIEAFAAYTRHRVITVGAAEYAEGESQRFESMSFDELVLELVDELADAVNYNIMLAIKALSLLGADGSTEESE